MDNDECITISDDEDVRIEHVVNLEPVVVDLTKCDEPIRQEDDFEDPFRSRQHDPCSFICSTSENYKVPHSGSARLAAANLIPSSRHLHHPPQQSSNQTSLVRPAPLTTILPTSKISNPCQSATQPQTMPSSLQRPPPPLSPPNVLKCPICIETYVVIKERGLKVVVTRCGHIFCDFCLKKAISDNGRKCPKCRKNIPKGATGIIEIFDVC